MEPANLTPPDDAQLDVLLRRSSRELPDDGFGARVLASLPPPRLRTAPLLQRPLVRNLTFSFAALAGLAFAIARGLSLDTLRTFISAAQQLTRENATPSSGSYLALALSLAALSVVYAMKGRFSRFL